MNPKLLKNFFKHEEISLPPNLIKINRDIYIYRTLYLIAKEEILKNKTKNSLNFYLKSTQYIKKPLSLPKPKISDIIIEEMGDLIDLALNLCQLINTKDYKISFYTSSFGNIDNNSQLLKYTGNVIYAKLNEYNRNNLNEENKNMTQPFFHKNKNKTDFIRNNNKIKEFPSIDLKEIFPYKNTAEIIILDQNIYNKKKLKKNNSMGCLIAKKENIQNNNYYGTQFPFLLNTNEDNTKIKNNFSLASSCKDDYSFQENYFSDDSKINKSKNNKYMTFSKNNSQKNILKKTNPYFRASKRLIKTRSSENFKQNNFQKFNDDSNYMHLFKKLMAKKNLLSSNAEKKLLNINNYDIVLNDEEKPEETPLIQFQNLNNNSKKIFNKQSNIKRIQNFLFKPSTLFPNINKKISEVKSHQFDKTKILFNEFLTELRKFSKKLNKYTSNKEIQPFLLDIDPSFKLLNIDLIYTIKEYSLYSYLDNYLKNKCPNIKLSNFVYNTNIKANELNEILIILLDHIKIIQTKERYNLLRYIQNMKNIQNFKLSSDFFEIFVLCPNFFDNTQREVARKVALVMEIDSVSNNVTIENFINYCSIFRGGLKIDIKNKLLFIVKLLRLIEGDKSKEKKIFQSDIQVLFKIDNRTKQILMGRPYDIRMNFHLTLKINEVFRCIVNYLSYENNDDVSDNNVDDKEGITVDSNNSID